MNMKTTHGMGLLCMMVLLLGLVSGGSERVWALTLAEAKAGGLVGETEAGYLEIVSGKGSAEVQALVNEVNGKRKQKYQEIAKRNRTSLQTVERLAGQTAIEKTQAGHYIQLPSGAWTKK